MVLASISQQVQLYSFQILLTTPISLLPPHLSNGCTVPIQFTKVHCRMLNPFQVALPFRIKTGLEVHTLTALLGRKQE